MTKDTCISDLGEFRFLTEVVFSSLGLEGDVSEDAAVISEGGRDLVVTVDRGNLPILFLLGVRDWRTYGWHLVASTLSDLAAVGARPLAFCSSIVLPMDFDIGDAREFFAGLRSACDSFGATQAGGNVAQGRAFAAHGFGAGEVPPGSGIRRRGCRSGDAVLLLGDGGLFMSAFVTADRLGLAAIDERQRASLTYPTPKLRVMQVLRERGLVQAASDDSDGVLGAIWNLATASAVAVEISADLISWPSHVTAAAELSGLDKRAIFFGWGGLQIAAAVRPEDIEEVAAVCQTQGVEVFEVGVAVDGPSKLTWVSEGRRVSLNIVRNEAFTGKSYSGTDSSLVWDYLRTPLEGS